LDILMVEVPFPPVTRRARNKKQKRDESLSANLAVKANFTSAYPNPLPRGEREPEVPSTKGVIANSTVLLLNQ
ncbi:MAG: hypothetical protein ACLQU5_25100, partial [Isosphaeraceae bacterium]